ncbi:MAG: hypothetical protein D6729_05615 [Deltaproteobacteria bacterium]|nr:MAG: hypothetical protein D6729_05615 [Deltaproteobacteria bacterium]
MKPTKTKRTRLALLPLLLLAAACDAGGKLPVEPLDFPVSGGGKTDAFGRQLVGRAAPYEADLDLRAEERRLQHDMARRRQVAWEIVGRVLEPVPLLGLAEDPASAESEEEIPRVPRWQTWYGVDDFKRLFQHLYETLGPEGRAVREPFDPEAIDAAERWNAKAAERSSRWPLERYLRYVEALGECPEGMEADACARLRQSQFSGAARGNARMVYSPATVRHLLESYPAILECLDSLETLPLDARPASDDNFSYCFNREFPPDAVLVKAQWVRADFGATLPAWDTDGDALARRLDPQKSADWGEGDRQVAPDPSEIFTIRLRNGDTYRLAGLHIMTKELRHWVWITLFWSDRPDSDFGADRPPELTRRLGEVWGHYKMCVVADYLEGDADPAAYFADAPSLAAALDATADEATWCSNPYIEHGRGNARTNCIGCHQHGGSRVGYDLDGDGTLDPFDLEAVITNESLFPDHGRRQMREVFPADYLWSLVRVDDLAQVIQSEVEHYDYVDRDHPAVRARRILEAAADPVRGETIFLHECAACHGDDGRGGGGGPSLYERVPGRDPEALLQQILIGVGEMPTWGEILSDQELADVFAYVRGRFDAPPAAVPAAAGDLVITEILYDPEALPDAAGEWLEIHNPGADPLDLAGCTIADRVSEAPLDGVQVAPGGYVTLARSATPGFVPDAVIGLTLNNGGDALTLRCGGVEIDAVDYGTGFPVASGASLSLAPGLDHVANDRPEAWCLAEHRYGRGDRGTPGAPNPPCP